MFDLQLDAQYELLGKQLDSYFNPSTRSTIEQLFTAQGYQIDRVFDDPANQFQALGLTAIDGSKPPVLVLPGGKADNPRSVGYEEFVANKQAIQDWLVAATTDRQTNPQGLKPDVTGVSRGGALTQLTASEFPTAIGSAVSFVSTGIDRDSAAKFLNNGGDASQVRHYITDGDWRSLVGDTFIPGTVTVGTYEIPLVSTDLPDYAARKHSSGILADFSTIFTDTSIPNIARLRALTDKPTDLTLSSISVDELNRPDFTFQGKDWQTLVGKLQQNNPNLEAFTTRAGAEEVRDHVDAGAILTLFGQAIADQNPVPPDRVNLPTAGDDVLFATGCTKTISGLAGDDYIRGGVGKDILSGNDGRDALIGNAGNDRLNGGADNDILTGGGGNDLFIFGESKPFNVALLGIDRINDFTPTEDPIGLSKATFTKLGVDLIGDFSTVTDDAAAATSIEAIVYNTSNGHLFYNTNGSIEGFGDGGQFATLFDLPTLSDRSFTLI
jgi:serralysin